MSAQDSDFVINHQGWLSLPVWDKQHPWLVHGFTTRQGGVSKPPFDSLNCGLHVGDEEQHVLNNRRRLAEYAGFDLDQMVCADQVHRDGIREVSHIHRNRGSRHQEDSIPETDGLYTRDANLLLTLFYADCVPLYFIDAHSKRVGLAHAGWRGTALGIGPKLIRHWQDAYQVDLNDIEVALGPSIGPCCYEVDENVIESLRPLMPFAFSEAIRPAEEAGKYYLDLKLINAEILQRAGIPAHNIYRSSWCTACHPDLFFSYRRDRKTGRMASFIALRDNKA